MPTHYSVEQCQANLEDGLGNLLEVYARATTLELIQGKAWYASAYQDAVYIAKQYNLPLEKVVQVACALSPRLNWELNMQAAKDVIRWFVSGGYVPSIEPYANGAVKLARTGKMPKDVSVIKDDPKLPVMRGPTRTNIVKALWILQGHVWVLRGDKVQSFCDNILFHETSQAVTIDSHAIQVWFGLMESGTYAVPPSLYDVIAADYRKAASLVGLSPLQFQAVTWLTKKRLSKKGAK